MDRFPPRTAPLRFLVAFLTGILLVVAVRAAHMEATRRRAQVPPEEDLAWLPRTELLRVASLGHTELTADLIFIRTLTYFGTKFGARKDYAWLPSHLDTIVELDPHFHGAYKFGGLASMYNGGPITNREVEQSSRYLERGLGYFPDDWEMAFMLGCNYLFELKTDNSAQRERWRRQGAAWIRRAAVSGGPGWLPPLAATIMKQEGEEEAAVRYLEEAFLTAPDDKSRAEILGLLRVHRDRRLERLQQAQKAFVDGWKATLPYAPADIYALVGAAEPPRLDWRYLVSQGSVARLLAADDPEGGEPEASVDGGAAGSDGGTP